MIGIFVLWLALQGQGQQPCKGYELNCNPIGEHVIEIRTKWVPDGWSMFPPVCDEGDETVWVPEKSTKADPVYRCYKRVKTLYIDNQRIGVIREVEEK